MKRALPVLALLSIACIAPPNGKKGLGDAGPTDGGPSGIAVIDEDTTDYMSDSVSLFTANGEKLAQDDCINSGATTPVLSEALSGDVILPTQQFPGGNILLIDRGNSALVQVSPANCMATQDFSVGAGLNPHDVVSLSDTKAYVTRYIPNSSPDAGVDEQGNDILIIDPSAQSVTGHIDLTNEATDDSGAAILASPDRAVLANGKVYVSLNEVTQPGEMTVGPAQVAIIDPSTDTVTGNITPSGIKNCSQLQYVASAQLLLVVCDGDYNDPTNQVTQSAVLSYDISGTTPVLVHSVTGTALGGQAISNSLVASVDGVHVIVATDGAFSGTPPDQIWNVDLAAGTGTKLMDAETDYVLGQALYDPQSNRVLITDADMTNPRIIVYDVSNPASPAALSSIVADPAHGLQPVYIGWY